MVGDVELSAGTIEYEDTGGSGPVVVLLHGVLMDGSLWRHVVGDLRVDHRCVVPTLPLGAHRRAMRLDADLSIRRQAPLVAELLERLELFDVTLVGNDTGGALAQLLISEGRAERVGRVVLASCEAFDNFPPSLPGRALLLAGKVPGGFNALVQPLRLRPLRRLPMAFGWMSKRPIPPGITDAWLRPVLTQRAIRRDVTKFLRADEQRLMVDAAEGLHTFDRPVLVVWASEDRVMPPEHGRRLADLFPRGRLVEIADSYTLIPEDQPGELARAVRRFIGATTSSSEPPLPEGVTRSDGRTYVAGVASADRQAQADHNGSKISMRLPNSAHESRPWRIREIVPDFTLEDVWVLPVHGGAKDFQALLEIMTSGLSDPADWDSLPARLLWRVRDRLGSWFGLGRISAPIDSGRDDATGKLPIPATNETSLAGRLPDDLRNTAADLHFDSVPFAPLYRTDVEFAAEMSNRTVHGVMHLAWVDQGEGRYQGQMAVYVKPRGRLGKGYMTLIKPFRYWVVYPALIRQIEREWNTRVSQ